MKCYTLVIIILILINGLVNLISGCGDGGNIVSIKTPSPSMSGSGTFTISVHIPSRKNEKVIPWNSKTLKVIITGSSIPSPLEGTAEIPAGGTATLEMTDVPVGLNVATIQLLDINGNLLAQRKHGFYMGNNATATAENISMGIGISSEGGLHCEPDKIEIKTGETLYFENLDGSDHSVKVNDKKIELYGFEEGVEPNQPAVYNGASITFDIYGTYDILIGDGGSEPAGDYGDVIVYDDINPMISSFTPELGSGGTEVTIYGTGFEPSLTSDTIVKFNGIEGSVIDSNSTYVVAQVPAAGSTGPISVIIKDRTATSMDSFVFSTISMDSISSSGLQGNMGSTGKGLSGDGMIVAFQSSSNNLVPLDTNGYDDVFIHDGMTGTTTMASIDVNGIQGTNHSRNPYLTPDGRFVEFESLATNLVPGDINGNKDIYHKDMLNNILIRVSTNSSGIDGNGDSINSSVSDDGLYVVFESLASNLIASDTNASSDIFVRNLTVTTPASIYAISLNTSSNTATGNSTTPCISGDGEYIAFASYATDIIPGTTGRNIFLWKKTGPAVSLVSKDDGGTQGNGDSSEPSISSDGRYVAFRSAADNLVSGDTNNKDDIFVHDNMMGTTIRVSLSSSGMEGNGFSYYPSISGDGQKVAFASQATDLVPNDTNGVDDIFVHNITTGKTYRISVDGDGIQSNGSSYFPAFSSSSLTVIFTSHASNLVPGDTNGFVDVFSRVIYP